MNATVNNKPIFAFHCKNLHTRVVGTILNFKIHWYHTCRYTIHVSQSQMYHIMRLLWRGLREPTSQKNPLTMAPYYESKCLG